IDDKRVYLQRKQTMHYIMLNKPRGYVTTMNDELGRRCVAELVNNVGGRVYPIGRLDKDSEGLLLFSNDGNFANSIAHPSREVTKIYRVTVRPKITDEQLVALSEGVMIDDKKTLPAMIRVLTDEPNRVVLEMSIKEGRNRQIRRMCESVGLTVAKLKRVSIGPLKLGMLKVGSWRELKPAELIALRNAIGGGGTT
ncbi:MAG: pseudouridine synthase, partial [Oscillospiraceae bacterium]